MQTMLMARCAYAASSVVCIVVFWLYGGARWTQSEFPIMDNRPLLYEILPLAILGLVLAATRRRGVAPPVLELVTALLWFVTLLAFALWPPMWNTVERLGTGVIDALAVVVGLTALSMGVLALQPLAPKPARYPSLGVRLLHAAGIGLLGLYFARLSLLFYASTRTTLSGGVAAVSYEARLRVVLCATVALTLAASALAARHTRGVSVS